MIEYLVAALNEKRERHTNHHSSLVDNIESEEKRRKTNEDSGKWEEELKQTDENP